MTEGGLGRPIHWDPKASSPNGGRRTPARRGIRFARRRDHSGKPLRRTASQPMALVGHGGMASLASLVMSAAIPVAFAVLYIAGVEPYDNTLAYIVGGIISAAIITWSLRPNIMRLVAGEERIVGPRSKQRRNQEEAAAQPDARKTEE